MIFATKGYLEFSERQLTQQREYFLERLREKDGENRKLRAELMVRGARIDSVEPQVTKAQRVRPFPVVGDASEKTTGPLDWQGELNTLLHEEEAKDGIPSE